MSLYSDLQGVAAGVLAEFKQGTVVLVRPNSAAGDQPWEVGAADPVSFTLQATVRAVPNNRIGGQSQIPGTLIEASDLLVTCAVPAVAPAMTDTLMIDGKTHVIKKIEQKPAAGTPVAFQIFVAA